MWVADTSLLSSKPKPAGFQRKLSPPRTIETTESPKATPRASVAIFKKLPFLVPALSEIAKADDVIKTDNAKIAPIFFIGSPPTSSRLEACRPRFLLEPHNSKGRALLYCQTH